MSRWIARAGFYANLGLLLLLGFTVIATLWIISMILT